MKNIQAQYQDLLEGKMSKANFMRNVRMQFPQHISSVSSFEDSVKILKGKRILSENQISELSPALRRAAYDTAKAQIDPDNPLSANRRRSQASTFGYQIDPGMKKKLDSLFVGTGYKVKLVKTPTGMHLDLVDESGKTAVELEISKDTYNIKQKHLIDEPIIRKLERVVKYIQSSGELGESLNEAFKDSTNNELASYLGTLKNELNAEKDPKKKKLVQKDLEDVKAELKKRRKEKSDNLNEAKQPIGVYGHNPNAEMDEYRGIDYVNYYQAYKGIQYELSKMPEITDENYIKARKKVVANILKDPDAYKDLQLANFKAVKEMDKDLEMKDVKKDNLVDKPNEMKVVKKDVKGNTEATLEKKEAKKSKTAKVPVMTQAPKGSLKAFETPGKEKVMALKEAYELEKNLDSLKSNATGALSAHKLSHGGDTKNKPVALKAIEDIKNATSAVQIFNILHKTGLFDKVEIKDILKKHDTKTPFTVANETKVQSLKEHILDELMQPNLEHEHINVGSRVKKKGLKDYDAAQVGNVTGFDGDTATVKWDNDSVEHLQINVLTKKEIPQLPDAAERWAKIPDSPFMKRQEAEEVKESEEDKKTRLKSLKEKIVKALEKEGYAVQTQGGQTLSAGKNTSQGITTARDLERATGDQLTVLDTRTGRKTQA